MRTTLQIMDEYHALRSITDGDGEYHAGLLAEALVILMDSTAGTEAVLRRALLDLIVPGDSE